MKSSATTAFHLTHIEFPEVDIGMILTASQNGSVQETGRVSNIVRWPTVYGRSGPASFLYGRVENP